MGMPGSCAAEVKVSLCWTLPRKSDCSANHWKKPMPVSEMQLASYYMKLCTLPMPTPVRSENAYSGHMSIWKYKVREEGGLGWGMTFYENEKYLLIGSYTPQNDKFCYWSNSAIYVQTTPILMKTLYYYGQKQNLSCQKPFMLPVKHKLALLLLFPSLSSCLLCFPCLIISRFEVESVEFFFAVAIAFAQQQVICMWKRLVINNNNKQHGNLAGKLARLTTAQQSVISNVSLCVSL